jgi:histidyl-tRNA synthetase
MTPTLARMVAARANALPRPIKWFSLPRMCRAEKPQRGRLREFFQWNADILGVDDPIADAEVIALAVAFFREIGLGDDVVIRVNSRPVLSACLASLGIAPEENEYAFQLIDKYEKMSVDEFSQLWDKQYNDKTPAAKLVEFLEHTPLDTCLDLASKSGPTGQAAVENFQAFWQRLRDFDVLGACEFHLKTVRGLTYYTGSVFEAHARQGGLRALMGGGRYDNLTGLLDGPVVPGVGFGMGDAPVFELLHEFKKQPSPADTLDVFVADADPSLFPNVLTLSSMLRTAGYRVDFSYKRANLGKQLKQASARGARFVLILGQELKTTGELMLKNLSTGEQINVAEDKFRNSPADYLKSRT